jgi:hypothetical protein
VRCAQCGTVIRDFWFLVGHPDLERLVAEDRWYQAICAAEKKMGQVAYREMLWNFDPPEHGGTLH